MKYSMKEIDGLLHICMSDPSKEELYWDNDIGGPSDGPAFFEMEAANGERVAMTIVVMRELKKDGVTDLELLIRNIKEALNQNTIH